MTRCTSTSAPTVGRTFALWGLAFKPNTDDMREAPSRVLMEAIWAAGGKVQAFDPEAMTEAAPLWPAGD
jgi:UDPglucose 6-dehydrogenase